MNRPETFERPATPRERIETGEIPTLIGARAVELNMAAYDASQDEYDNPLHPLDNVWRGID